MDSNLQPRQWRAGKPWQIANGKAPAQGEAECVEVDPILSRRLASWPAVCESRTQVAAAEAEAEDTIQLDGVDPAPCQGHPATSRPELRAAAAYVKAMCQVA